MKRMITSRPITGHMEEVTGGKVFLPVETPLTHLRDDLYEVSEMRTVSLVPPTVMQEKIRFRINPYIARSDLRVVK